MSKTTVVTRTGDATGTKMTSKSKAALGIPEDHVITWVPFSKDEADNDMLFYWNKSKNEEEGREIGLHIRMKELFTEWLNKNRTELQEIADTQVKKSEKSLEDMEKELEKAQKAMEKKMERINAMRALQQK